MYKYEDIRQVHLEVTSYCNASCPQCLRNFSGGPVNPELPLSHLSLHDCKKIFSEPFLKQLRYIFLCGNYGDAMMAPELLDILEYFKACNPTISLCLYSNGSGRNTAWWQRLARSGTVCKFAIDGLEDTNHIYRRGTNWNKIIASINDFIGAGGEAHWEYIAFKHNQHQVEEACQLSKELGFKQFNVKKTARFYNPGQPMQELKREVSARNSQEQYTIQPPDDSRYIHEVYTGKLDEIRNEQDFDDYLEKSEISCTAITSKQIYVSAEGLIFPCCYLAGIYNPKKPLRTRQVLELIEQLPEGKTSLNAKKNELTQIVGNDFFTKAIPESWDKHSFKEGKLYTCAMICGSKKLKL